MSCAVENVSNDLSAYYKEVLAVIFRNRLDKKRRIINTDSRMAIKSYHDKSKLSKLEAVFPKLLHSRQEICEPVDK